MQARLNRLLAPDGRCLNIALDHGIFGEGSFLRGIESLSRAVSTLVQAGPDAVQLAPGQAHLLQSLPGKNKPALVLRTDTTNVYAPSRPRVVFSELIEASLEQALRWDAASVVVNLLWLPDAPELLRESLRNIARLKPLCERYGLPLMIEPLVMRSGGYEVDGDEEKIVLLVRQAVELGADLIKADFTSDLSQYHRVIEAASGRPVLVRGGGRVEDDVLLERTYQVLQQGAAGVVYGRNIIQHPNPPALVQALLRILHQGATPAEALKLLRKP